MTEAEGLIERLNAEANLYGYGQDQPTGLLREAATALQQAISERDELNVQLQRLTASLEDAEAALQPFANFAVAARRFVKDRAQDGGSPLMPTNQFRLSDFERAAAFIVAARKEKA